MLIQEKSQVEETFPPSTPDGSTPLLKILPSVLPGRIQVPYKGTQGPCHLPTSLSPAPILLAGEAHFQKLIKLFPLCLCSHGTCFLARSSCPLHWSSPSYRTPALRSSPFGFPEQTDCLSQWVEKVCFWVYLSHQARLQGLEQHSRHDRHLMDTHWTGLSFLFGEGHQLLL